MSAYYRSYYINLTSGRVSPIVAPVAKKETKGKTLMETLG